MNPYSELQRAGYNVTRKTETTIMIDPRPTAEWREFAKKHKQEILDFLPKFTPTTKVFKPDGSKPSGKVKLIGGVGTELKGLIPKWFEKSGCGCSDYARDLDQHGIDWCRKNQDRIIKRLVEKASETFLGSISETLDRVIADRWVNKATSLAITNEAEQIGNLLSTNPLIPFSDGSVVVSAVDDRYVNGATLMVWTLLQQHRCRVVIYDLGVSKGMMRSQLERWGVEFVRMDPARYPVPIETPGWQIFNKPAFLDDALTRFRNVLWLDADTAIANDVTPLLDGRFNIPDHGTFNASGNATKQPLTDMFGPDVRQWSESNYPCAGIIGLTRDHYPIVDEWLTRTRHALDRGVIEHAQFYDQTILQTFLDVDLVSGNKYSNFSCVRHGCQNTVLRQLVTCRDTVAINHYGGLVKPFLAWPDFVWPVPRGAL